MSDENDDLRTVEDYLMEAVMELPTSSVADVRALQAETSGWVREASHESEEMMIEYEEKIRLAL